MDDRVKPAFTQKFAIALLTDGDVIASEIGQALESLGYHGVWVQERLVSKPDHEHPCPSSECVKRLRAMGHIIKEDASCCDCWWG